MFNFEKRDEGLFVTRAEDGRAVAHVDTREIKISAHLDGDPTKPKLAQEQRFELPIPRDKWRVHFTAYRITPPELAAFVEGLAAQPG